jgi:hypothetical protein
MPSISHSEVSQYTDCRRKHYYGYGRSLKPVSAGKALVYGSAGHSILEAYYSTVLAAGDTLKAQQKAHGNGVDAALEAWENLKDFRQPDNRADLHELLFEIYFPNEALVGSGHRIVAVEKKYSLRYDDENDLRFPFVVDLVVIDPEGRTVIVDHKFVYDFYSIEATNLMGQLPKYIGALRALNHKVDYGAYNMIRSRKLKNLSPEMSMDFLPVRPNNKRVETTFLGHIRTAAEIQALKELSDDERDKRAFRVDNKMTCNFCDFKSICVAEQEGASTKLLLATEFETRERGEQFEVSDDA